MGLIPTKWDLALCNEVTASSFCRRRLPVVMVRSKMCGSVQMATKFVQQGHVRIGPEVVKDPAFLVTRYFLPFFWNSEQAGSSSEASGLWQRDAMFCPPFKFIDHPLILCYMTFGADIDIK